jgi:hypothetical protein
MENGPLSRRHTCPVGRNPDPYPELVCLNAIEIYSITSAIIEEAKPSAIRAVEPPFSDWKEVSSHGLGVDGPGYVEIDRRSRVEIDTVSGEIVTIRNRLKELDEERDLWGDDPFVGKMDLLEEERELRARLAHLQGPLSPS